MLQVDQARAKILRHAPSRRTIRLRPEEAQGLILAEDVFAPEPLPPFSRSGMDGYAVRSADTQRASREAPLLLPLAGAVPAGHPMDAPLLSGTCAAIMTGGAIPTGADAVIRLEEVRVSPQGITFFRPVAAGENVAPIGEDVAQGARILRSGHQIRAAEINLLIAVGVVTVAVYAPVRVGILSTGDELVPAGQPLGAGQIYNSNGPGIAALVRSAGCDPVDLGIAHDVTDLIAGALSHAADCDLILTTGGVSVGEFDVVREALTVLGAEHLFWRVAIKPGMPVCVALLEGRLVVGLSGNPAAAITNFDLLVRPLLDTLCGRERIGLRVSTAVLDQPVLKMVPLDRYLRARVYGGPDGELRVDTSMAQRAGVLSSMAIANAYALVPGHTGPLPAGSRVKILLYNETDLALC